MRLTWNALIVLTLLCSSLTKTPAAAPNDPCDLPKELQSEIGNKYPAAGVVTLSLLSEDDREFFQKEHQGACPGVAEVDFYGDGKATFALVLISKQNIYAGAKLLIARQDNSHWKTILLDSTDRGPVPVVWVQMPGQYQDISGKIQIRAAKPVIVFTGYESWSVLYAWTGDRVRKIQLRD